METLLEFTNVQEVLQRYAKDIDTRYKEVLADKDHIASRDLFNSIKVQVEVGEREYSVTMRLLDYWKYLEHGTKPHWPPVKDLINWIEVKPVIPRPLANGKLPTTEQLAYLIGRKIATVGTEGTHGLEKTKNQITPFYLEEIQKALARDVREYVRKMVVTW